ncbi:N-acetyl sugar amidotransferase [Candidatus Parcubacteria bacterium]|nr:MAG: N-acetyl sugar amidotransferase [Candidatus Parcubacteria bacterium]
MFIEKILDQRMGALPKDVYFCTNCVNSNQRLGLTFDENGVCDACNYAIYEKENRIDWSAREEELRDLCNQYRSKDGIFDCIVPASGGKDSCYVAHQLKYEYGMHPLTVTWAPAMFTDIGFQNYHNMCKYFDNIMAYPNRTIHGKLARLGFELWGDIFVPWHYGQRAYPLHMAIKLGIPLIMYGEKTNVEYGGRQEGKDSPVEDWNDRKFLESIRILDQLIDEGFQYNIFQKGEIEPHSLDLYRMPPEDDLSMSGIQVHWFSYYKKWIPQENYYYARQHCGFKPNPDGRSEGTYSKYASLDDKTDGLHFYMQLIKFGFGRCTSEASQEVRSGHIYRNEAVALVHKYDLEFPKKYFKECLEYMGMEEEYFWRVVDKFRPEHLWHEVDGEWRLRHMVK